VKKNIFLVLSAVLQEKNGTTGMEEGVTAKVWKLKKNYFKRIGLGASDVPGGGLKTDSAGPGGDNSVRWQNKNDVKGRYSPRKGSTMTAYGRRTLTGNKDTENDHLEHDYTGNELA